MSYSTDKLIQKLKKYSISRAEFERKKDNLPYVAPDNDVIWAILIARDTKYSLSKSYPQLRDTYWNMAELLNEEKQFVSALEYYCKIICLEINGISHGGVPTLRQGVANRIYFLREHYDSTISSTAYSQLKVTKRYTSEDAFVDLINDICSSSKQLSHYDTQVLIAKHAK